MANLRAAGIKSLGEWMCLDGENSSRVHDAFDEAQPLKLSAVMAREPRLIKVSPARPDKTRILDLSIHELGSRTSIWALNRPHCRSRGPVGNCRCHYEDEQ